MRRLQQPSLQRRAITGGLLAAAGLLASRTASAQRSRSLIVPFTAGHDSDIIARTIAQMLADGFGQSFIVENIPGAGGVLAGRELLKRAADGTSLLLGHSGLICNTPLLSKAPIGFDPQSDFVPICAISRTPFLVVARFDFPASNLAGLQQSRLGQSEALLFASSDVGSGTHIAGELILKRIGIVHANVPYRDSRQAAVDVAEGRVPIGIFSWQLVAGLLKAQKLKVLALLSDAPLGADPGLPTLGAQGLKDFDYQGWYGLFTARGTPA